MAEPEFTDTARASLLWVLWHHQGGSSKVGQPLRFALGMGAHDRMSKRQVEEARRWGELHAPAQPAPGQQPVELLGGWKLNHIHFERGSGKAEIGYLDDEDDRFSPIVTIDTGLYYRPDDAVPLARAILDALATQASAPQVVEPAGWVNGSMLAQVIGEGAHDGGMLPVRKAAERGFDTPIFTAQASAPSVQDDWRSAAQAAVSHLDYDSGAPRAVNAALRVLRDALHSSVNEPPAYADTRPAAPSVQVVEKALGEHGVFKGADGLRRLAEADEFWERQEYGTRLYFGSGISDYLHRDVLRAAIRALEASALPAADDAAG